MSSTAKLAKAGEVPNMRVLPSARWSGCPHGDPARAPESSVTTSAADLVQVPQELVRRIGHVAVPPLERAVHAGDQSGPVHPPEVPVDERVPCLGPVVGPLGEPEVPGGVVVPGVVLEVAVLHIGPGLDLAPVAVEDVLPLVDQLAAASHRRPVHVVRRHAGALPGSWAGHASIRRRSRAIERPAAAARRTAAPRAAGSPAGAIARRRRTPGSVTPPSSRAAPVRPAGSRRSGQHAAWASPSTASPPAAGGRRGWCVRRGSRPGRRGPQRRSWWHPSARSRRRTSTARTPSGAPYARRRAAATSPGW